MRHRVAHRKLGRTTPHRIALLRNLATALFEQGADPDHPAQGQGAPPLRRAAHHPRQARGRTACTPAASPRATSRTPAVVKKLFDTHRRALRDPARRLHAHPAPRARARATARRWPTSSSSATSTSRPARTRRPRRRRPADKKEAEPKAEPKKAAAEEAAAKKAAAKAEAARPSRRRARSARRRGGLAGRPFRRAAAGRLGLRRRRAAGRLRARASRRGAAAGAAGAAWGRTTAVPLSPA